MLNTEEIRNKEVINIYDGKSMGFVCDIEINLKEGRIDGIVLPGDKSFMKIFGRETNGYIVKWKYVKTVGEDVILVDVPPVIGLILANHTRCSTMRIHELLHCTRRVKMKCPYCENEESRVIDSRHTEDGHAIRRRRECESCGRRFTTYEKVEEMILMVIKKDGRREAFDRSKLLNGIIRACEKRPVSIADMEKIVDEIERGLNNMMEKEVDSTFIGELVNGAAQGSG